MPRPEIATRPQPGDTPASYQPRVVVKIRDVPALVASVAPSGSPPPRTPRGLEALRNRFPDVVIEPLIRSVTPARLQAMMRDARRAAGANARPVPDLNNFFSIALPREISPDEVVAAARQQDAVELAYVQAPPTRRPVTATDDPRAATQGYLDAAPGGIDARFAWTVPGGDGTGVTFVDQEGGWRLDHEDLVGGRIRLLSGVNKESPDHGTSVLGEVLSQDNTRGCIGIAPLATGRVISEWRTNSNYSISDAIISAYANTQYGDVLLIETQETIGGSSFLPVEVYLDIWAAIRVVTWLGLVVVEAGGNGSNDLDSYRHPTDGFILQPGHANFRDSGAILVGAGSSAAPHRRLGFSNYGRRVNCYAWGENIVTTDGPSTTAYTTTFGGTSGASPIIAGAAVVLQALAKRKTGRRWSPQKMREVLSEVANGTPAANPGSDKIGVMPNLRAIVRRENLDPSRSAPGDFPTPRRDVQYAGVYGDPAVALADAEDAVGYEDGAYQSEGLNAPALTIEVAPKPNVTQIVPGFSATLIARARTQVPFDKMEPEIVKGLNARGPNWSKRLWGNTEQLRRAAPNIPVTIELIRLHDLSATRQGNNYGQTGINIREYVAKVNVDAGKSTWSHTANEAYRYKATLEQLVGTSLDPLFQRSNTPTPDAMTNEQKLQHLLLIYSDFSALRRYMISDEVAILDKFALNRAELTAEHQAQILALARYLDGWTHGGIGNASVLVMGHTDARGTELHNDALGKARADAVKRALDEAIGARGLSSRIGSIAKTMGEKQLRIAQPRNEREHARNRRVAVFLPPPERRGSPQSATPQSLDDVIRRGKALLERTRDKLDPVGISPYMTRRLHCVLDKLSNTQTDDTFINGFAVSMDPTVRSGRAIDLRLYQSKLRDTLLGSRFLGRSASDVEFLKELRELDRTIWASIHIFGGETARQGDATSTAVVQLSEWMGSKQRDSASIYNCYHPDNW